MSSEAAAAASGGGADANGGAGASRGGGGVPSAKSLQAIQRARESRARKAAIAAARAATRAKTMQKKAEAKAAGGARAPDGKVAASSPSSAAPSAPAAAAPAAPVSSPFGVGVSVPPAIPFRIVDLQRLASVLSKFVDSGEPLEDMSDRAFQQRHRPLERNEKQIRKEEIRDSIVRWAICDAPTCRKWRVLPKNASIPSDASVHWYCGNLTSRNGGRPSAANCARRDDWILKCVGESLTRELERAGITTVEMFEQKERDKAPQNFATYAQRMRQLGVYYDPASQTICKYK